MHYTSQKFWLYYHELPITVQQTADNCYELLKLDPNHPSLHFKKIGKYWSVRVGKSYRAVGVEVKKGILWFWIGPHAEYDRLIGN